MSCRAAFSGEVVVHCPVAACMPDEKGGGGFWHCLRCSSPVRHNQMRGGANALPGPDGRRSERPLAAEGASHSACSHSAVRRDPACAAAAVMPRIAEPVGLLASSPSSANLVDGHDARACSLALGVPSADAGVLGVEFSRRGAALPCTVPKREGRILLLRWRSLEPLSAPIPFWLTRQRRFSAVGMLRGGDAAASLCIHLVVALRGLLSLACPQRL